MKAMLSVVAAVLSANLAAAQAQPVGTRLELLSWAEAENALTPERVVVIPLGAASKEHGLHLPLNSDQLQAEYYAEQIMRKRAVVVAPNVGYNHYPPFLQYPGSVSLRHEVARDMMVDIVRSLALHGPRRFYVINTGFPTRRPLQEAAEQLAAEGLLLTFHDGVGFRDHLPAGMVQQEGGTHADEVETSLMLHIAPEVVRMERARRDYHPKRPGPLVRKDDGSGTFSATGAWGDPTLASLEKGRVIVETKVQHMLADIDRLAAMPLPAATEKQDP